MLRRFRDRNEAGRYLAGHLLAYQDRTDVLVLALPRGGVPVAFEIAGSLNAPLDVFTVRKLGVPGHEELAMGAIATGDIVFVNRQLVKRLGLTQEDVDQVVEREREELKRRETAYRDSRPFPDIKGKTVILVDDGLATGASMTAAVQSLKLKDPARIVVAVPLAAPEICAEFKMLADEVICAMKPYSLQSVGAWYQDFRQTTDEEVLEMLRHSDPNLASSRTR
jgi:predicted phosphoribosyltransferase